MPLEGFTANLITMLVPFSFPGNIMLHFCKWLLGQKCQCYGNISVSFYWNISVKNVSYVLINVAFSWIVRQIVMCIQQVWHRPGTVMRITCSTQGKQLLGFLGQDRAMLACLPMEQSCPATHCPRHTAQMSGRGLAAGGIPLVTAGHTHPLIHHVYLGWNSTLLFFKCPMGVMPKPCDRLRSPSFHLFLAHVLPPSILFFSVFIAKAYVELLTWIYKQWLNLRIKGKNCYAQTDQ